MTPVWRVWLLQVTAIAVGAAIGANLRYGVALWAAKRWWSSTPTGLRDVSPPGLTVGEIMAREVVSVKPESPVAAVLDAILDRGLRAIPVVDEKGVCAGTIHEEDLLTRAGASLPHPIRAEVAALGLGEPAAPGAGTAAQVMHETAPSVRPEASVAQAAARMAEGDMKRLAVVDESGRMIGILSRSDVLKTVVDALEEAGTSARPRVNLADVAEAMQPGGVRAGPGAALGEVLDHIMRTRSRYVVVTDAQGRVVGIIREGDILKRAGRKVRPEIMRAVGTWLKGGRVASGLALAARGKVASEVMSPKVVTIAGAAYVSEALRIMIDRAIKVLPVMDGEGRSIGKLSRSSLLAALARKGEGGLGGAGK